MHSPPRPKTLSARFARLGLRLMGGWQVETDVPPDSHAVMLAGPHTSNVDGLLLVLVTRSIGMRAHWMVKDTWTKGPIGWVTKRVGAVGIDRSKATGMVGQMVEQFARRDEFLLLVPPEGTRGRAEHWKSGFYLIAMEADVPVIGTYLDYSRKRAGFGDAHVLTGDRSADMDIFRAFYADGATMARTADKFGPVRLRDESDQAD